MGRKETVRVDLVAADLSRAQSIADLGVRAVIAIGRNLATSAVSFSPLWTNPEESEGAAIYHDGCVNPEPSPLVQQGVILHAQEVANLNHLFSAPNVCLNAESIIGWRQYRQTRCYKEHWQQYGTERQFIMGLGSITCIKGLLVACRPEQSRPFDRSEKLQLLQVRDAVSSAMVPFRSTRKPTRDGEDWKRDGDDHLRALSDGVPFPTIVWNSHGRLVWLNHEAELRLDILPLRHGSTSYYTNGKQTLADLWTCASNELARPGWSSHGGKKFVARWIAPNENLLVRSYPRGDKLPLVFLCFAPTTAPELQLPGPGRPSPHFVALRGLSLGETAVALDAADGYTVPNIAAHLDVAESEIQTHLKSIYRKLNISSRAELTKRVYGK